MEESLESVDAMSLDICKRDTQNEILEHSESNRFVKFNDLLKHCGNKDVYRGYDNESGCEIAWNSIKIANLPNDETTRIKQDIQTLQSLHHPNILNYIDAWFRNNTQEVIFITELASGSSVRSYLRKIRRPFLKVIKRWCKSILIGLNYLHGQPDPVILRNLTCGSILVNAGSGEWIISDLGLSILWRSNYESIGLQNPDYVSPEFFESTYGPCVDIYAFGMSLLEICLAQRGDPQPQTFPMRVQIAPNMTKMVVSDDLREFIELCLLPVGARPTAEKLLQHPFLNIDEESELDKHPVVINLNPEPPQTPPPTQTEPVKCPSPVKSDGRTYNVRLNIVHNGSKKNVDFPFDTEIDHPDEVAEELIKSMNLNSTSPDIISKEITSALVFAQDSNN